MYDTIHTYIAADFDCRLTLPCVGCRVCPSRSRPARPVPALDSGALQLSCLHASRDEPRERCGDHTCATAPTLQVRASVLLRSLDIARSIGVARSIAPGQGASHHDHTHPHTHIRTHAPPAAPSEPARSFGRIQPPPPRAPLPPHTLTGHPRGRRQILLSPLPVSSPPPPPLSLSRVAPRLKPSIAPESALCFWSSLSVVCSRRRGGAHRGGEPKVREGGDSGRWWETVGGGDGGRRWGVVGGGGWWGGVRGGGRWGTVGDGGRCWEICTCSRMPSV